MMIKLVSLNTELRKHFHRIFPFLREASPDVVCLQEVVQETVPFFEQELGMHGVFTSMGSLQIPSWSQDITHGNAIFSRLPIRSSDISYYYEVGQYPEELSTRADAVKNRYPLMSVEVEGEDGILYTIATTHFPVSAEGRADDFQRAVLPGLLAELSQKEPFVLCGDFNAPRGGEIFSALGSRYRDAIPAHYTTSLDPELHRAQGAELMVDGLFLTPEYEAKNTRLQCGLSDHCAIVSEIQKM